MDEKRPRRVRAFATFAMVCLLAIAGLVPAEAQSRAGSDSGQGPKLVTPSQEPSSPQTTPQSPAAEIRSMSNLVAVPVTVTDRSGDFVYDLTQDDFRVLDNNVPQRIALFETEDRPVAAVILIQTNEAAKPLFSNLTNIGPVISQLLLGPKGDAAVLFFADRVRVVQDFSNSPATLNKTIQGLDKLRLLGDKARLNDALTRAISLLQERPQEDRRVILAISMGSDSGSETSQAEVLRRATASGVTIYGLRMSPLEAMLKKKPEAPPNSPLDAGVAMPMPPGVPPTPDMSTRLYETPGPGGALLGEAGRSAKSLIAKTGLVQKSDLDFLSKFTGGVYYSQWTNKGLQSDLNRIANEVHSQYELAYVPNDLTQTGFHRIDVQLVNKPHLRVRTREGYFYYKGLVGHAPSPIKKKP